MAAYGMFRDDAKHDANMAWDGEGYYRIGWSDGGMDWTSNGPSWFDDKADLVRELECAYERESNPFHLPYAEKLERFNRFDLEAYLGGFVNEFDMDGIIEEATVMYGIHRYWSAKGDELDGIIQSHELVS